MQRDARKVRLELFIRNTQTFMGDSISGIRLSFTIRLTSLRIVLSDLSSSRSRRLWASVDYKVVEVIELKD